MLECRKTKNPTLSGEVQKKQHYDNRIKLKSNIKFKQITINSSFFFFFFCRQWNDIARNSKISCRIHLRYNAQTGMEGKTDGIA